MLRTAFKSLLVRRRRLMATALAIVIGVAFVAGTLVLTDTISRTFSNLYSTVYKGTSASVRTKAAFTGIQNSGAQRAPVDASLVASLANAKGVAADAGEVMGYARLVGKNGKALGNPSTGAPTYGGAWLTVPKLNSWTLVAGRPPAAANEMVIDKKSATDGHLKVGDTTTVLVEGPPRQMLIVGIVKFGSADSPGGASIALFTSSEAQQLVGQPGKFNQILFAAQPGVSQAQLAGNLQAVIPSNLEAVTGQQLANEGRSAIMNDLSFINDLLLIFGLVALIVGAFMIFNSFSITVAQRTRENGLMRALGATRRQVLWSVLLEALAVGLLGSVIGLAFGVAVAVGLKALMGGLGLEIPAGGVVFAARTVIVALVLGTGVTMLAALSPARKAGKVSPVAAMQEALVTSTGYGSKQRVIVGSGVLAAGVAAVFVGLFAHPPRAVVVVGAGALLVFFAVAVLGRTVSLPLSRIIGAPLPRLRGISGTVAYQNAMRNPKRTAATASALMICVALISFFTIFASSTNAAVNSLVNRGFVSGDLMISTGANGGSGGVDPSLAQKVGQLPQVAAASSLRVGQAKIEGSVQQIVAVDPVNGFKIWNIDVLQGNTANLGPTSIAIYKNQASAHHLKVGEQIPVLFANTGVRPMTVAAIFGAKGPADYYMSLSAYQANFPVQLDYLVLVKSAPGVSQATTEAAIKTVSKAYPGTSVLDKTQYEAQVEAPIKSLLTLIDVLMLMAVIIALLGIGNTLALSILDRIRELGLMRAVGMTRRQLRSTIRLESIVIALQGAVLGLVVGVAFGYAIAHALNLLGTNVVSIPYRTMIAIVVLAGVAGVVAAIRPARRAAKLNILRAVVSE
jgi:putative ABC transport system permease protein